MKKELINKYRDYLIQWLRDWFENNGKDCNAIIGISGGKDSTCVSALCVAALGADRVIGVLMPNGEQNDIEDSYAVCRHLGIRAVEINIGGAYQNLLGQFGYQNIWASDQTKVNLAPRLRMSTLYAVSQSLNGRVIGTSNLDETMLGFFTRWGDGVSDCEPIIKLHANEVVELGLSLGVPEYLMKKAPSDGLTGSTDEQAFGFTYQEFQDFYEKMHGNVVNPVLNFEPTEKEQKMLDMCKKSDFKRKPIPEPDKYLCYYDDITVNDPCSDCINTRGCITCTDYDQYIKGV